MHSRDVYTYSSGRVQVHMGMHAFVYGSQRSTMSIFLNCSLSYFLRQGFSLKMELINAAHQLAHELQAPTLSLHSQCWGYRCTLFRWVLMILIQVLMLTQHFINFINLLLDQYLSFKKHCIYWTLDFFIGLISHH